MEIHGKLVDIHEGRIFSAEIEIEGGKITRIAPNSHRGKGFLIPGFVDSFLQLESTLLPPQEFARIALRHGTLAVCTKLSELEKKLLETANTPFKFFDIEIPPLTHTLSEARAHLDQGEKIHLTKEALLPCLPLIEEEAEECLFASVHLDPASLLRGHLNPFLRKAVQHGVDPIEVLRVATLTPTLHYNLPHGLLRLGDPADFLVVEDLKTFRVLEAYIGGECVFKGGNLLPYFPPPTVKQPLAPLKKRPDLSIQGGAVAASTPKGLLAAGSSPSELDRVLSAVEKAGGGIAITTRGQTDLLPLPVGGVLSNLDGDTLAARFSDFEETAKVLGISLKNFLNGDS